MSTSEFYQYIKKSYVAKIKKKEHPNILRDIV